MVMIKEMSIPKRCKECKFCLRQRTNEYGSFGECLLQKDKKVNCLAWSRDDKNCLIWSRDDNCPLVEVVTCKDCKYNDENFCMIDDCRIAEDIVNDCFCACASRKDNEQTLEYTDQNTMMSAT